MKTALRFVLILGGITFSTESSQVSDASKSSQTNFASVEKITQTCDVVDVAIADSLT